MEKHDECELSRSIYFCSSILYFIVVHVCGHIATVHTLAVTIMERELFLLFYSVNYESKTMHLQKF